MERVERVLEDPFYRECLACNADRESGRIFCRHDFQHMLDVARIAYIMVLEACEPERIADSCNLASLPALREAVYAAGLVHDIARWIQYDTGEDHALAGARLAGPLLVRAGFNTVEVGLVTSAVREHRSSAEKTTLLGKILCLADDLSRPCGRCAVKGECYKFAKKEVRPPLLY
ncbi:MAG: HD domain-containing protein [Firmicutes bacterium]|nr:HD domain-containing protein [Bacillota bacterium]